MKSILENRPDLRAEIEKIAEVAGYLWQNGWAERNGGNITVNITQYVDDELRALPAISEVKQIGVTERMLFLLQGNWKADARPRTLPHEQRQCDPHP